MSTRSQQGSPAAQRPQVVVATDEGTSGLALAATLVVATLVSSPVLLGAAQGRVDATRALTVFGAVLAGAWVLAAIAMRVVAAVERASVEEADASTDPEVPVTSLEAAMEMASSSTAAGSATNASPSAGAEAKGE